ncbi:hypothetical protein Q7Q91_09790 [Lactiplantibacillus pentosus]|uniref:hypothetical protein n=1 Tax=Lactiplantibacillus pentosus TaxID=1589 RepID=UPI0027052F45|nr:hypothetical protein [Lactiplantibacillus pentosus]MDO7805267.1 hypothetical protein [Lactiplantibacillus pentosus]
MATLNDSIYGHNQFSAHANYSATLKQVQSLINNQEVLNGLRTLTLQSNALRQLSSIATSTRPAMLASSNALKQLSSIAASTRPAILTSSNALKQLSSIAASTRPAILASSNALKQLSSIAASTRPAMLASSNMLKQLSSIAMSANVTANTLNAQIQNVTAMDLRTGAKFNTIINQLGLKNVKKTQIEIKNMAQLFGPEVVEGILHSINESTPEVVPTKPIKKFTEVQEQNAEVSKINETSYAHEGKNGEPAYSIINKILQQYHSLSKMKLIIFNAILGELFSAMLSSLISNVGLANAIIMMLILTAPYNEVEK